MVSISRRMALLATVAIAGFAVTSAMAEGLPPLKQKATYKVGFAQTESNNPWRLAQTASMKAEAEKLGWQLVYTDAAGSAAPSSSTHRPRPIVTNCGASLRLTAAG